MGSFYRKIYLKSWELIKNNCYLLIFGLFVSLLGFREIRMLFNLNNLESDFVTYGMLYWLDIFKLLFSAEFTVENMPTILNILGVFIIFAILLVFIISSQGALIKSCVNKIDKSKKDKYLYNYQKFFYNFIKYLQVGIEHFWNMFILIILNGLVLIILISGIIIPMIDIIAKNDYSGGINFFLSIVAFFMLVPLLVIVSLVTRYGLCYIIIKKDKVFEAFLNGWRLFRANWVISIENSLFLLLITIIYILIVSVITTIIAAPFLILASLLGTINYTAFWFIIMTGSLSIMIILLLTIALWGAYYNIVWTNTFLELTSKGKTHSKVHRLLYKK